MCWSGEWGDGIKNTQRMRYYDIFDPRARYTYEGVTTSPAMTIPRPEKSQAYIGKLEDEDGNRLHGGDNYVIRIEADVPASLFWSIVIYDADTRCLIDNRNSDGKGKATVGSRTKGLRKNADGSDDTYRLPTINRVNTHVKISFRRRRAGHRGLQAAV